MCHIPHSDSTENYGSFFKNICVLTHPVFRLFIFIIFTYFVVLEIEPRGLNLVYTLGKLLLSYISGLQAFKMQIMELDRKC